MCVCMYVLCIIYVCIICVYVCMYVCMYICMYVVYMYYTGCPRRNVPELRESIPHVKVYRYNPKHLYPNLNGYGDNGLRKMGASCGSK